MNRILSQTPQAVYFRTKWYPKNRTKHKAKTRQAKRDFRKKIDDLKNKPCADCKHIFPPCAVDFDHLFKNEEKVHISLFVSFNQRRRALREIAKMRSRLLQLPQNTNLETPA